MMQSLHMATLDTLHGTPPLQPAIHHIVVALCLLQLGCIDPDGRVRRHSLPRLIQDLVTTGTP